MTTGYPGAIDNFNDPTAGDNLNTATVLHTAQHTNVNDAVNAIETELGINPKGAALSVKARLDSIDTALAARVATSALGAASGVATLDSGSMLVQNVDGAKITTGSVPVARIPNLDVAKITTGIFNVARIPDIDAAKVSSGTLVVARIPGLPGSQITSGTIAAARLPSSVTANANSRVVADVAGRDAIPLIERVDGMIVTVRSPWTQYTWRADSSTWRQSGGPGKIDEPHLEVTEATDQLAVTATTANPSANNCKVDFLGPQSGQVWVGVHANFEMNTAGQIIYIGFEVRTGTTAGSGTLIQAMDTDKSIANGATTRILCGDEWLVSALTSGSQYHARVMYLVTGGNGDIFNRRVTIKPVN